MAQRIKGQETRIIATGPNGTITGLSDVVSFNYEPLMEILSQGLLGETTERKDDIFKGVRGKMEVQLETQDYLRFIQAVVDRSQRRTPGVVFNLQTTLNFPNGERPRVLFEDVFFGPQPVDISSREDYVTASLDFECSNLRVLY